MSHPAHKHGIRKNLVYLAGADWLTAPPFPEAPGELTPETPSLTELRLSGLML